MTALHRPSPLDRALRPFADVRTGEGVLAVLLALNVFLILTTYYILKPVREALILGQGSAELKTYLSVGQVALLSVAVPYYGRLASKLDRRALLNVVTYFFVACLGMFYVTGQMGLPIGIPATGEYILGSIVTHAAQAYVADGRSGGLGVEGVIGAFYSRYFALINITSLLLQLFVVSRVVKYLGVSTAVTILPALSLVAYNVLAFLPSIWPVMAAKVSEKGTDYSLSNTVRNMLFLPCTREEKYSAKQVIDSFFFRMGDVVSATLVFIGTHVGLTASGFAMANVLLAAAFLGLAVLVGRAYLRRTEQPGTSVTARPRQATA